MIVETSAGRVRGVVKDGVASWKGVPYAGAPVGPDRFRAPPPVPAWAGVRDALEVGPIAMQSRDPRQAMISGVTDRTVLSEDCLSLNVWAPATPGPPRPVMVWIHGGAFIMGSGSTPLYNGRGFASRHDLIVVTINYRLGLFGFLYLGDLAGEPYAAGNAALPDQIAALRWVRDNIAGFGGDPGQVTIMGESAGAFSIGALLAAPAARGLFHRAILQSGASSLSPPTRADATATAELVMHELGVSEPDALAEVPAERLVALQEQLSRKKGLGAFTPFVDGVTLPARPLDRVRAGDAAPVPLLLGSNRDEWTLFELLLGGASAGIQGVIRHYLGAATDRIVAAYVEARADRSLERAWTDLVGDVVFRIPMIHLAEAQAGRGLPVWMYRFDHESTGFGGRLRAAHAIELPFVWDRLDLPFTAILLGDVAGVRPLATAMHDTWATFIRTGAPDGGGLPPWPRYDARRRATMLLDRAPRVADDPGGATRALWPTAA